MSGKSEMVKRAAVARFLGEDPEEVRRMMEMDGMPHVRVPGPTRPAFRVFLPDLHRWLCQRADGCQKLADYEEFRRAFFAAQRPRKSPRQAATNNPEGL